METTRYIVLKERKFPKQPGQVPYSVVLAFINDPDHPEYVTWIRNDDTGTYGGGNYFWLDEGGVGCMRQQAERSYHLRVAQHLAYQWNGLYDNEPIPDERTTMETTG